MAKRQYILGPFAAQLGTLILRETPYPGPKYRGTFPGKKMFGPGKPFDTRRPFKFADVTWKKANLPKARVKRILARGFYWNVGPGKTHRMSKVIRIPYTYFDPKKGKNVNTALVIGYEGAGGGC